MAPLIKIKNYLNKFRFLKSNKERNFVLKSAKKKEIKLLIEVVNNLYRGNIKLTEKQLKKLKKHRNAIKAISSKKLSINKKRDIFLRQSGGFLSAIVSILAPILAGVIGNYV